MTTKNDPFKYLGSGKYWKRHLKKYGKDITTEILFETESKDEFVEKGIYYSNLFNIVEDESWANLRIECGDGGDTVSDKIWITNETVNKYHPKKENIPDGWRKGRVGTVFSDPIKQSKFAKKARYNDSILKKENEEEYNRIQKEKGKKISELKKGKPNIYVKGELSPFKKDSVKLKISLSRSKPVKIDNIEFGSIKKASEFYNVQRHVINKWIKNGRGIFI